jgi:hypothetical protein
MDKMADMKEQVQEAQMNAMKKNPLAGIKLRSMKIGDTLQVFQDETAAKVHAEARRALGRGEMVVWEDGTKEWLECRQIINPNAAGSSRYTWSPDGNKVKANVYSVTQKNGRNPVARKTGTRYVEL